ncbi:PorP/SprF family type IX secretion system membrane protein [Pedobacter faecalis]|uniref:PorP/SprF family type IX secretion system membrane protein n=1 Tax=Pedobacter faecalis TaxID=3041495 RepID=UPI00254BCAD1|nr:type IX secretion system membrane protein PorP/SprF [Pedobacter sp. ELA7]
MKRFILPSLVVILFCYNGIAQQRPQYTQYIFNNFLLNPALSGIENYTDVKVGHRKQWTGINDAPQTSFLSAHWKFGDDYLWRNPLSLPDHGDDPMSRNYMQNYTASPSHHGMGVMAVLDDIGPLSRLDAALTYAYHMQMAGQLNLSVGVSAGISRIGLDVAALNFGEDNPQDPAVRNAIISQIKPDLGLGVWLYGARFFAGASVQQLLSQEMTFTNNPNLQNAPGYVSGKEVAHYFFTAGYRFFLLEDVAATPSMMLKKVKPAPASYDLNLKLAFKDRFWLGGSYRKDDAFAALLGVNFNKLINLTYSYDFTTSALNSVSNGSHEIVLGLQLNNVYEVLSTTRMW